MELLDKDAVVIDIDKGEVMLDQGAFITHILIVIDGRLKVSQLDGDGNELFLYFVEPLESCVMTYTCSDGEARSKIRAIAEIDSEVLLIPKEKLDVLMGFRSWRNFVMNFEGSKLKNNQVSKQVFKWIGSLSLGALAGYAYYYFAGCDGICAISSCALNSSLYGMGMGGLFKWSAMKS